MCVCMKHANMLRSKFPSTSELTRVFNVYITKHSWKSMSLASYEGDFKNKHPKNRKLCGTISHSSLPDINTD